MKLFFRRPSKNFALSPLFKRQSLLWLCVLLFSQLLPNVFSEGFIVQQQQKNEMTFNGFGVDKQNPSLPLVKLVLSPANSLAASHQLLFDRLSEEKDRFLHRQMAKTMAMGEGGGEKGGEDEVRPIPRQQRRWLMRTTELKGGGGGDQFVKRVVSESELNALLKNAWLGKKRR